MAIIVQVTVTDDDTGEVKQSFAQTFNGRDSWDEAYAIRNMFKRVFAYVFGEHGDWPL